ELGALLVDGGEQAGREGVVVDDLDVDGGLERLAPGLLDEGRQVGDLGLHHGRVEPGAAAGGRRAGGGRRRGGRRRGGRRGGGCGGRGRGAAGVGGRGGVGCVSAADAGDHDRRHDGDHRHRGEQGQGDGGAGGARGTARWPSRVGTERRIGGSERG